jgi:hypothetical protein
LPLVVCAGLGWLHVPRQSQRFNGLRFGCTAVLKSAAIFDLATGKEIARVAVPNMFMIKNVRAVEASTGSPTR